MVHEINKGISGKLTLAVDHTSQMGAKVAGLHMYAGPSGAPANADYRGTNLATSPIISERVGCGWTIAWRS